jgi:endonuclease G
MQFRSVFSKFLRFSYFFGTATLIAACSHLQEVATPNLQGENNTESHLIKPSRNAQTLALLSEGFETGIKSSYTTGNVTLSTGSWTFNDALIGNLSSDAKTGAFSARLRNVGSLTTLFNKNGGAGIVTIKHAKYGTDANSTWELWVSANSGSSWTKVGNTITTSSSVLSTASFTVNRTDVTRFQIRKTGGGTSRLNIDDIAITDYTGTGNTDNGGSPSASIHLTMGNPSGAVKNTTATTNYLLEKSQYVLSYHRDRGIANWISWYLASNTMGSVARQDNFRPDDTLPAGWYRVTNTDYTGSGFDRGHLCPSGDRTATVTDNSATFFMTNMMPQAADNNQGAWEKLESYCRTLAAQGNELYIIAGSYGVGGTGINGLKNTIANGKVTVPNRTWKVVVVLPNGNDDINRVNTNTRIIAIDMPNTQGIRNNSWGTYRVSVDFIESKTGYNILSALPESVQTVLESRVDNGLLQ